MIRFAARGIILCAVLLTCGCGDSQTAEEVPEASETKAAIEPKIQLASWQEVEELVASQQGKVVVLDVWSTWCVPCIREFPNLVELQQRYDDQVACISLNCNYTGAQGESPDEARDEIATFLKKQNATFENVISTTPDQELFEILNAAAVPIVRVYDKQGELVKQFVNDDLEYGDEGFSYDADIDPLVKDLVERS